jgi:predicted neuraminidase
MASDELCFNKQTVCFFLSIFLVSNLLGQMESGFIFPLQNQHVHGATLVECPNGDILTAWFQGFGEKTADDVVIKGARLRKGSDKWSEPFIMADHPGFPDVNPMMFIDPQKRLWIFWYTVIANQWETSLPRYRISSDYSGDGTPKWDWQDVLILKPGGETGYGIQPNDPFVKTVERKLDELYNYYFSRLSKNDTVEIKNLDKEFKRLEQRTLSNAKGPELVRRGREYQPDGSYIEKKLGFPLFRRIGWQTKNKAIILDKRRLLVPLYSDEFSFSLMAITDDWGKTWQFSEPLVGAGNVQPCIVSKQNGHLVAYMRDNGPPPKKIQQSESADGGFTWSMVTDSDLPNPAAGTDAVTLANGHWAMVYNDSEQERYSLAISISDDEGKTWKWTKHLERDDSNEQASSGEYPAIIQGHDGMLHVVYSFHQTDRDGRPQKTIKYAKFPESWVID